MDFPSQNDLEQVATSAMLALPGLKIDPAQVNIPGSDVNLAIKLGAALGTEVIRQLSISDRARYLDTADGPPANVPGTPVGPETQRLAFDFYGLAPKPATTAIGTVLIARGSNVAGAGILPAGFRFRENQTGQVFTLLQQVQFTALGLTGTLSDGITINIPATGTTTGAASSIPVASVAVNVTWSPVDTPFDNTIVIFNTQPLLGADAEDSPTFKQRVRGFFPSVQKGTLQAIQNAALTVPGVFQAVAIEVTNVFPLPAGLSLNDTAIVQAAFGGGIPAEFVQLYIGNVQGQSNSAIAAAVATALTSARAAGIYVQIIIASPQLVYITLQGVSVPAGVDPVATAAALQTALVDAVNALQPGQALTVPYLFQAALNAGTQATLAHFIPGTNPPQPALTLGTTPSPAGSLDLTAANTQQVFRATPATITVIG